MDLLPVHEDIVDFVNAGVSGFILKDATFEDLVSTIKSVAQGKHVLPPQMTSSLFSQIAKDAVVRGRAAAMEAVRMTSREREVIDLIGEGLSNKEIATRLTIATHTVKSHVRNVMESSPCTRACRSPLTRTARRPSELILRESGVIAIVSHALAHRAEHDAPPPRTPPKDVHPHSPVQAMGVCYGVR